jgi:hypothetical protein
VDLEGAFGFLLEVVEDFVLEGSDSDEEIRERNLFEGFVVEGDQRLGARACEDSCATRGSVQEKSHFKAVTK